MDLKERAQKHIERLDIIVKATEIKWGVMWQIEALVPQELADKFNRQWEALSSAITDRRHEDVIDLSDGAVRGIWAMEKAAILAGNAPVQLSTIGMAIAEPVTADVSTHIPQLPPSFWAQGGDTINF